MRASDLDRIQKDKFKPKATARHWGGFNGTRIPDELKPFIKKHVKQAANGNYFINQYPDKWYYDIFYKHPDITDFDSFFAKIKPYFSVQRTQHLS